MEKLKFKTNINCGGCVAKVTPALNETVGEGNWQVDTSNAQKVLTVNSEIPAVSVVNAVKQAGFNIEVL